MKTFLGILTRGIVPIQWALGFQRLDFPGDCRIFQVPGLPFDHARNVCVEEALQYGAEWLFFLDDDVIPPRDAFGKLISHRREVVSGLYYKRLGHIVPTMYREGSPPNPILSWKPNELLEVDYVGGGCLAIHRSALERVARPWFKWEMDRTDLPPSERLGEDCYFSKKARQAGLRIYVDTSVRCLHAGFGRSDGDGKFAPLELNVEGYF